MVTDVLTCEQRRALCVLASAVAAIIAGVEVAEVGGNVVVSKSALVAAFARYFAGADVDSGEFINRCYGAEGGSDFPRLKRQL